MKSFFIGNKEIRLPIIQRDMGVEISLSGHVAAVANEGGIGVILYAGLGFIHRQTPGDYLRNCILGLKKRNANSKREISGSDRIANIKRRVCYHKTIICSKN
ncbi:MAG: hypothetical protein LBS43_06335 [Prevotellaceae bacterium]|jgi:NAD(P)H-dependent flavin oxidoreductase YrpB (nitropropane dioxygenase family)|nr:hypothetical protein [Prevotellaceae bacterium]